MPAKLLVSPGLPALPETTEAALSGGLTSIGCTFDKSNWVELRGFEPLTSSMPWKRATNCAIAPNGRLGDPSTSKNSSRSPARHANQRPPSGSTSDASSCSAHQGISWWSMA